jgi:HEPN domain-containing protein
LGAARNLAKAGDYNWAAFASQQAAEKAIKVLFQHQHLEAWGHAASALVEHLPEESKPAPALIDRTKELDKHYIPTRYPNGFERGAPVDYYTRNEADTAIGHAEAIIEFCRNKIG